MQNTFKLHASALVLAAGMTWGAPALAQAEGDTEAADEKTLDTVTVTGIRRSLEDSIGTKRDASSIVDAISSEDIGKLPDENIAESLQRITGVSITRNKGEGQFVSIRGLSPDLVRVTINGRTATSSISNNAADDPSSESVGRRFAFDQLGSELLSSLEVYKTPTADLTEGGVAGTINIKTPRPFDNPGTKFSAGLFGAYSELSGATNPRGSALFSQTNADSTFGYLLSASYSERDVRQDSVDQVGYQLEDIDIGGDGTIDFAQVAAPRITRPFAFEESRERLGVSGVMQWAPSDTLEITGDLILTEFTVDEESIDLPARLFVSSRTADGALAVNDARVQNGTLTYVDTEGADVRNDRQFRTIDTQTMIAGLNGKWESGPWNAEADLSLSRTEVSEDRERAIFDARGVGLTLNFENGDPVPDIGLDFDPNDGSRYEAAGLNLIRLQRAESEDEELALRLDGGYQFQEGVLSSIETGFSYRDRSKTVDEDLTNIRNADFAVNLGDFSTPFIFDDFLSGSNADIPRSWAGPDNDALRAAFVPAGVTLGENELADFKIEEEILAAYVKANFEGELGQIPFSANAGLRYTSTDQTSNGFTNNDLVLVAGGVSGGGATSGGATPVSADQSYDNWLPSANITFDLSEDLLLRFAAAEVMTRPDLQSSALFFNINEAAETILTGNPGLDPFKATQFDVSLEWYFAPASILSAAVFHKDIDSFITSVTQQEEIFGDTFIVTRPINGEGATISGLELSYQQIFDSLPAPFDGFGVVANYTYVDSDAELESSFAQGKTFSLEGLSEHSYNLVGFYEKNDFSARLAYNHRSEFLSQLVGFGGNPVSVKANGQLDASLGYAINDRISLSLEAVNITDEPVESFFAEEIQLRDFSETGRRFFFGVRASF
ncbi:MAG: TonB-dependent receptor [Henriciella sp.]